LSCTSFSLTKYNTLYFNLYSISYIIIKYNFISISCMVSYFISYVPLSLVSWNNNQSTLEIYIHQQDIRHPCPHDFWSYNVVYISILFYFILFYSFQSTLTPYPLNNQCGLNQIIKSSRHKIYTFLKHALIHSPKTYQTLINQSIKHTEIHHN